MAVAAVVLVAAGVGWWAVPALAAWAPGTATPLQRHPWRAGQAVATMGAAVVVVLAVPGARLVPLLALVPVLVAFSAVDLVTRRLPDRLVRPAGVGLAGLMVTSALGAGRPGWLAGAAVGAGLLGAFLGVVHLVAPAGLGLGDVKFAALLGAALGWVHPVLTLTALFAASVGGALVGGGLALARHDRSTAIPFGPFLAAGAIVALAIAPALDLT